MSSISVPKPLRMAAEERQRNAGGRPLGVVGSAVTSTQDRSATALTATGPVLFWKIIATLAMVLSVYNVIGVALLGSDWLFACWNAWEYWCAGGYCP